MKIFNRQCFFYGSRIIYAKIALFPYENKEQITFKSSDILCIGQVLWRGRRKGNLHFKI